jgi:hypothetical protein
MTHANSSSAENRILGTRFTEMHSGMRAYTREVLNALNFEAFSDDFLWVRLF